MSRSSHRRRRSNSKLARYSYIRHATRLEIYDVPISGAFLLPDAGNAWHGARSSLPQPDLWARWVTVHDVPGILAMGPAAIKRSRMKSRRWWSNPIDYRRIMATSLELRRREEPWHREDRDYLGRGGVRSCALDEDLDDPRDEWGCDDGWDDDPPQSDSEVVDECAGRILRITDREAPRLAPLLRSLLAELAGEVADRPPPPCRDLRQLLILDARGAIGRARVWYAWRNGRLDWLAGVPGEDRLR